MDGFRVLDSGMQPETRPGPLDLKGWVENQSDGSVYAVIQGLDIQCFILYSLVQEGNRIQLGWNGWKSARRNRETFSSFAYQVLAFFSDQCRRNCLQ